MLTSLEPPSPASSVRPREVEVTPPCSLQHASLPCPPSVPEASSPKKPDAPAPFKSISIFERWLQTRSKKINKNHALEPPDGPPTTSSRSVKPRFRSKSQPGVNTVNKKPSGYTTGQRVRVSLFFAMRRCTYLTKHLSEWSQNPLIGFVV